MPIAPRPLALAPAVIAALLCATVLWCATAPPCAALSAAPAPGQGPDPMPAPQTAPTTYTNPIGDLRMGDPFVFKHADARGARYYLYGTAGRDGFLCWTSPNLADWTPAGYASHRTPDTWGKSNFWAPEVVRYRDKFYMVYSASRTSEEGYRLCIATSDAPTGPFVDLHAPWLDIGWSAIDADLFIDDDGAPYIFFDKVGVVSDPSVATGHDAQPPLRYIYGIIYGAKLTDDLSAMIGDPVKCIEADQPWEQVERTRVLCNEGAFVFRRRDGVADTLSDKEADSQRDGGDWPYR